jgi:hypothetical protein
LDSLRGGAFDSSAKLLGPSGSILLPDDDEITRKLAMLFEANVRDWVPLRPLVNSDILNNVIFNCWNDLKLGARWLKVRGPELNIFARTDLGSTDEGCCGLTLRLLARST